MFASRIGAAGFVIASGLARGIDAAAHEAALERRHRRRAGRRPRQRLSARACRAAAPDRRARLPGQRERRRASCRARRTFPRRNRIISGIALGVLIVEAARRSGTLITARTAAEQGREVFAVPGHPLDPRAEGTNRLLKTGATMATEPEDVIATLCRRCCASRPARRLRGQRRSPPPAETPRLSPRLAAGGRGPGPRPPAGRPRAGAGRHRRAGAGDGLAGARPADRPHRAGAGRPHRAARPPARLAGPGGQTPFDEGSPSSPA